MSWVAVGIGAVVGGVSSAAVPAIQGKPITWEGVLIGTAMGAAGGAAGGAAAGAGGGAAVGTGTGVGTSAVGGAAPGVVGGAAPGVVAGAGSAAPGILGAKGTAALNSTLPSLSSTTAPTLTSTTAPTLTNATTYVPGSLYGNASPNVLATTNTTPSLFANNPNFLGAPVDSATYVPGSMYGNASPNALATGPNIDAATGYVRDVPGYKPYTSEFSEVYKPDAVVDATKEAASDNILQRGWDKFAAYEHKIPAATGGMMGASLGAMVTPQEPYVEEPTENIYDPEPFIQRDIPRSTVPRYYAAGGIVPPQPQQEIQPQQPAQPMNRFVQMGVDAAKQTYQAQQVQPPQAGIPVPPTQMQPQQSFANGGGIGNTVAPGAGNMLFGGGRHEDFMRQVQEGAAKQLAAKQLAAKQSAAQRQQQQLIAQRAPGSQTAQTVAPIAPIAPVAPVASVAAQRAQVVAPVAPVQKAAAGGIMQDSLGGYSHGGIAGLTRGPGDGVSDSIPAQIGNSGKQPARLADGEFVVPARIVSELGNGSTEAGAKALQTMVDRVQARRSKTIGKGKVAVNSKARKGLPA